MSQGSWNGFRLTVVNSWCSLNYFPTGFSPSLFGFLSDVKRHHAWLDGRKTRQTCTRTQNQIEWLVTDSHLVTWRYPRLNVELNSTMCVSVFMYMFSAWICTCVFPPQCLNVSLCCICLSVCLHLVAYRSLSVPGQPKQVDPELFKVFYNFWKETEAEAQDVNLPSKVIEHLDDSECVYKLSSCVKTSHGVGKIAMTQKRLFLLTEGRLGFLEITKFRDIQVECL